MQTEIGEGSIAKRRLMVHDSLAILSLTLVTILLFFVTLFLFRSFTAHRSDLAQRWSERGRAALQAGKPNEAIVDMRTALSYAPDTHAYELLLAQALGASDCKGCAEESYQYFLGLWDAEPGNGEINLQLARLAAKRSDRQAAVNFYRAAIDGTWEGDGITRRAEVRVELARYLIEGRDLAAARLELLTAGGNAPDDFDRDVTLGELLREAGDPTDAWTYARKAVAARPGDPTALEAAGRLAYAAGDFEDAHSLLTRAQAEYAAKLDAAGLKPDDVAMLEDAARILELIPSPELPARERVAGILAARAIAKRRFDACSAEIPQASNSAPGPQALDQRWAGPDGTANLTALLRDSALQGAAIQLIYDTEIEAQKFCSAATGDDALLLQLAATRANALPGAGVSAQPSVARDGR